VSRRRASDPREEALRRAPRVGAFFDVDGTLTASDVFRDLVAFRAAATPAARHRAWMLGYPVRGLLLLALDSVSRTAVNRVTASWYRRRAPAELAAFAARFQAGPGLARMHGGALDLLAGHARAGHRIVFVTGSVDLFVEPLARLLEARLPAGPRGEPALIRVEALRLAVASDRFTGGLAEPPLALEEKARRARAVAAEEGLDLAASHAYGDSIADLPLLDAVGRPAAVNPDRRLRRLARRRGWPVLDLPPPAPEPA
jgi:HAD superfamily hydrolase (TIGR01490 family)